MEEEKMISSLVSGVSGFNANAYALADDRAKRETGGKSAIESGLRPEDYWTPDRMRNAVHRNRKYLPQEYCGLGPKPVAQYRHYFGAGENLSQEGIVPPRPGRREQHAGHCHRTGGDGCRRRDSLY